MELTGNTMLITGGGSGIGAGLARAFHRLGNTIIVAGRDRSKLERFIETYPGMAMLELDVADVDSVQHAAASLRRDYPLLNTVVNNAGIMLGDDPGSLVDEAASMAQVQTNLLGPIRLTSALMAHLRRQPRAHLVYVTAVAGFTPVALFAMYSATKAALHSYVLSQRFALKDSRVTVQEIIPPWVGTGLVGPADHALAVPLDTFIEQTMDQLQSGMPELVIKEGRKCRDNPGRDELRYVDRFNTFLLSQSF